MDKEHILTTGREKSQDSRRTLSETMQTFNAEEDRHDMHTRKASETSSSTDTSPSSPFDAPEVQGLGRPPLDGRVQKSLKQAQQIAELQQQLLKREQEFYTLQQHVLQIMTSESLTNPYPATPTYVDVEGTLVTKLSLLQTEMKKKDTEYRDTLRYLQSQRAASRGPLETPGPHRLQELNTRNNPRDRTPKQNRTTSDGREGTTPRGYSSRKSQPTPR
jgi:hypothetical protein